MTLAQGDYQIVGNDVRASDQTAVAPLFLVAGTIYVPNVTAQFTVPNSGGASLSVSIEQSANLNVKGFPAFLSFGGCANLTSTNANNFVAARESVLFTYAGFDGAGDSNQYLTDDTNTSSLISLARTVESKLP